MLDEVVVGAREVMCPEESASVGRQGGRVGCGEHQMAVAVDECSLTLGI